MRQFFEISKAFSDQNRMKILKMLSDGPQNVSSVATKLKVEENLASHHLRVLHTMGLLSNDKQGRQVFYSLNKDKIVTLIKDLSDNPAFREIMQEALDA